MLFLIVRHLINSCNISSRITKVSSVYFLYTVDSILFLFFGATRNLLMFLSGSVSRIEQSI